MIVEQVKKIEMSDGRPCQPMSLCRIVAAAVVAAGVLVSPAAAADKKATSAKHLAVELNNMNAVKSACRLTFMVGNKLGVPIDDLAFELVLFGKDKKVLTLLRVNAGRLPVNKSRVKQFDLKAIKCADVSHILLNDVTRCKGEALTPHGCLTATKPSSRLKVGFIF